MVEHHPKRFKISQVFVIWVIWKLAGIISWLQGFNVICISGDASVPCFSWNHKEVLALLSGKFKIWRYPWKKTPVHNLSKSRCVPSFAHQVLMPPVEKPSSTPFLVNAWRSNHSQWMLCTYPTLSLRTTDGPQKTPFNLCAWLPDESGSDVTAATAELGDIPASKSLTEVMNINAPERLKINLQKCQRLRSIRYDCVQFVA